MQFRLIRHLLSIAFVIGASSSHGALVFGGFSSERVGIASIGEGPITEDLRASILTAFPGATFVSSDSLSSSFLETVDCLIIGSATVTGVNFLESDEQINLLNFIKSGGGALIFIDNDQHGGVPDADRAAETYLDPFGIDSSGYLEYVQIGGPTDSLHPVMDGPFGPVETMAAYYSGAFEPLSPEASSVVERIAEYDADHTAVLGIGRGKLGTQSGGVVFFSDSDIVVDSADTGYFGTYDNKKLILNSIAYVVPEPSATAAGLVGFGVLACRRRRRC